MSIDYTILDFPDVEFKGQIFYVPGISSEGGYTSGGAVVSTFEPGGYGILEITLARRDEFMLDPEISWLMSQTNGQFLRVQLAQTPQLVSERSFDDMDGQVRTQGSSDYVARPKREIFGVFASGALKGSRSVTVDLSNYGPVLKRGHLIGHEDATYQVQSISYAAGSIATIEVSPPFRKNIVADDVAHLRPWFIGTITNGSEIRAAYESTNNGAIELPTIKMREVIL